MTEEQTMKQTSAKKYIYHNGIYYLNYELVKVLGTRIRIDSSQKRLSDFDDQKE